MKRPFMLLIVAMTACGSALHRGEVQFAHGEYAQAKETFVGAEDDSRSWTDAERAQYALYRGLTHSALGDHAEALRWLLVAKDIEDRMPGTLSPKDFERLKLGLEHNGGDTAPQ